MTSNLKAFLPLLLFVFLFLGAGTYYHIQGVDFAFYQLPAPVAAIPAIILSLIIAKGKIDQRLDSLFQGMGDTNILTMCMIYLLAGAFGVLTKQMGAVEASVQLGLNIFPSGLLLPGLFLLSSILSLAMGTSMGTISAIGPIAFGLAEKTGLPMSSVFGALVGGAMFGDNLSIISDTTIAATRTQGAAMLDKFKENIKFALPAALLTMLLLAQIDIPYTDSEHYDVNVIKLVPYLALLLLALTGLNVFAVLFAGLLLASVLAFFLVDDYSFINLGQDIFAGFKEMQEIFLLSMMIGGLGKLMKDQGGILFIQNLFLRIIKSLNGTGRLQLFFTELGLAISVSVANLAVANNTVAILICGDFFKEISHQAGISAKRSASILDTFSCITQGLIPYGAQVLLASQISKISPLELILNVKYCFILAGAGLVYMAVNSLRSKH